MIRGVVTRFKARVSVQLQGSDGQHLTIEADVDTGFNGMLTLPFNVIAALGLVWESEGRGVLADGRISRFDIYNGTVIWHGHPKAISVSALDMFPAIGMGLLDGSELNVKVRPGGMVTIKPLRRRPRDV
jgi:clan AA aspartic protease